MKIKTVTLNNFRGFPGPPEQKFDLDGKNLLVYGENGAGKSSLFHALKTFFTLSHPNYTGEARNIFSDNDAHSIEVEFDDGHSALWEGPPKPSNWTSDSAVVRASEIRGCLDYRDLLNTNYIHGKSDINLFDIAVTVLLADFEVDVSGGATEATAKTSTVTIAALWKDIERAARTRKIEARRTETLDACRVFNEGFRKSLDTIKGQTTELLNVLPAEGMELNAFEFSGVSYNLQKRVVEGDMLRPAISLYAKVVSQPQHFLNEARLSALALAIYLAGRLTSVPPGGDYLKLLVLDDVLIGLDLSNRLPLLDLLHDRFGEWQIVLLTHDKIWFDMAEIRLEDSGNWQSVKMFEGAFNGSFSVPIVAAENKSPRQTALDKAEEFLRGKEYQAAANYARSAFEATLKDFCDKRGVPVPFKLEARELKTEDFLAAISAWTQEDNKRIFYAAVLERAKLFRRIILNPLSHADAPAERREVEGAIAAVRELTEILGQKPPQHAKLLDQVRAHADKSAPTPLELQSALAILRARFAWSLRQCCEKHKIDVSYKATPHTVSELWDNVRNKGATLFAGTLAGSETQIEAERSWVVDAISERQLNALTQADIQRLLALLNPNKDEKTLLDQL